MNLLAILIRYSYGKNRNRKKSQYYVAGIEKYDSGKIGKRLDKIS